MLIAGTFPPIPSSLPKVPSMPTNSLHSLDVAHHIHPVTNLRRNERQGPIVIDRGEGIYVYDEEGREYIEAMAGLRRVGVGFGEPRLVEAAASQMAKLPYCEAALLSFVLAKGARPLDAARRQAR